MTRRRATGFDSYFSGQAQHYSNRTRPIAQEEPRTWDTPHAAREREQLRKMEKAMDGVGWTALVVAGLIALAVIYVQCGKYFYGW
jgi:cytochrome c-type biogenesis protein CcmH/NrfG